MGKRIATLQALTITVSGLAEAHPPARLRHNMTRQVA